MRPSDLKKIIDFLYSESIIPNQDVRIKTNENVKYVDNTGRASSFYIFDAVNICSIHSDKLFFEIYTSKDNFNEFSVVRSLYNPTYTICTIDPPILEKRYNLDTVIEKLRIWIFTQMLLLHEDSYANENIQQFLNFNIGNENSAPGDIDEKFTAQEIDYNLKLVIKLEEVVKKLNIQQETIDKLLKRVNDLSADITKKPRFDWRGQFSSVAFGAVASAFVPKEAQGYVFDLVKQVYNNPPLLTMRQ